MGACYTALVCFHLQTIVVNIDLHVNLFTHKYSPRCVSVRRTSGVGVSASNENLFGSIKSISIYWCICEWSRDTRENCFTLICPAVSGDHLISRCIALNIWKIATIVVQMDIRFWSWLSESHWYNLFCRVVSHEPVHQNNSGRVGVWNPAPGVQSGSVVWLW